MLAHGSYFNAPNSRAGSASSLLDFPELHDQQILQSNASNYLMAGYYIHNLMCCCEDFQDPSG